MINIRKHVFETNSSSMHSLVVVKDPKPYSKRELRLDAYTDKSYSLFGWGEDSANFNRTPFQVLRTPQEKLRYYVAHEIGNCEKKEKIPEIKAFISKQVGIPADKVRLTVGERGTGKNAYYGYVEHNDTGESPFEYIKRKNISMEELVLNPKYMIIVDGDEYCEFQKMFESNLLNAEDFEDISSGADFWNHSDEHIYLNWLGDESDEFDVTDCVEVNKFTKTFTVYIDENNCDLYNAGRLRIITEFVKEQNPNVITRLLHSSFRYKGSINKKNLDTSMFDVVDLEYHKGDEEDVGYEDNEE